MDRFEKKRFDIYYFYIVCFTCLYICLYNNLNSTEIGFKRHTTSENVKTTHVFLQFLA